MGDGRLTSRIAGDERQRLSGPVPLTALEAVTKNYGNEPVLDGITLELSVGEFVTLSGPSGTGKSTLARLLVGLSRPTSGRVLWQGRPLDGHADIRRLAGKRQIVFQNPLRSLSPRLTVEQIVVEPALIAGGSANAGVLIERVGLPRRFLDRRARQLSVGECQRVALARALSTEPDLLVLDEPTSSLDPIAGAAIAELIEEAAGERAVFLISHSERLLSSAGRRLFLQNGRLVDA